MIFINKIKIIVLILRPIQWTKNLVIFAPLFFDIVVNKQTFDIGINVQLIKSFIIFCIIASCVYIFNDIKDYNFDKLNPLKNKYPIASGRISFSQATVVGIILLIMSIFLIFISNLKIETIFFYIAYVLLNIGYCFYFKNITIIEFMIVPLGFLLRMMIGFFEADAHLSFWMIIITFLGALLLIVGKRKVEFKLTKEISKDLIIIRPVLKNYSDEFFNIIINIITSNIIICYLIYLVSSNITYLYGPIIILTFFPVLYGLFRYIELIFLKDIKKDPVDILFKDKFMRYNILIWLMMFIFIFYNKKYDLINMLISQFG